MALERSVEDGIAIATPTTAEVAMPYTRIDVRRILCPVDFTDVSARALEHAVRLASFFDATVHVTHVVPSLLDAIEPALAAPDALPDGPRERAARELARFVEPVEEWHVRMERSVRLGNPAREIEMLAAELPADVVVMGTHGRKGVAHLMLGSVAEKVLHRVTCPVLTVSAKQGPNAAPPFRRILCATDLLPGSEATIDFALALAAQSDAQLEVLHVIDGLPPGAAGSDPFEGAAEFEGLRTRMVSASHAELRAAIRPEMRKWCRVEQRVATGDAVEAILEAARASRAEVIVLGARAHAVDRALFGATTHRVMRDAPCPVLVLRQPRPRAAARTAAAPETVARA
jgi:nucleotide-binding universal stress UspA family protein